jgi:hypothetical protein
MSGPNAVAVPAVAPGKTADIAVTLFAPAPPGMYKGIWQFKGPRGDSYGDRISVTIIVPRPLPTPTRTPVPPPRPSPVPPPQPLSINFWADKTSVGGGECTNLHWSVTGVQAVYLEYGGHSHGVNGNDQRHVCPSNDGKTYTLRAILRDGSQQTREIKINTDSSGKVRIELWADSTSIEPGACINVNWETENAESVRFFNGDDWKRVNRNDHRQVCPDHSTTYKIEVHDIYGGDHDRSVKVKVSS